MMKVTKELIEHVVADLQFMIEGPIIIGGSASLVILGLIDREIHDVDVFTTVNQDLLEKCQYRKTNHCYEYYQLFIPELSNVDLFMVNKGVIKYYAIEWQGLNINVLSPYDTIYAKTVSYQRKHIEDIKCISKVVDLGLTDERKIIVE